MNEVRYSINGKYFKDFGIYVSDSDGLFDALKRKKVNSYDWADYHGSAPDLSSPKFEQREISLKCFVVGDNWEAMKSNFDAIISEFQKAGTQRLLIEPFGLKALPYEVAMVDEVSLKKTFREGKTFGTFTLKLIEPNPIKKVLYFTGDKLNLSYTSPNETEIFYGNGLKDVVKGNASLSGKVLANRVVSGYGFEGRNLLRSSKGRMPTSWSGGNVGKTSYGINYNRVTGLVFFDNAVFENLQVGEEYTISIKYRSEDLPATYFSWYINDENQYKIINSPDTAGKWNVISDTRKIVGNGNVRLHIYVPHGIVTVEWMMLTKGNKGVQDWSPAAEDEKYIIISGNIEEITDLTTNADKILWERL